MPHENGFSTTYHEFMVLLLINGFFNVSISGNIAQIIIILNMAGARVWG
jgi:hypothetical protein